MQIWNPTQSGLTLGGETLSRGSTDRYKSAKKREKGESGPYPAQGDSAVGKHARAVGDGEEGRDGEGKRRVHARLVVHRDKVEKTG